MTPSVISENGVEEEEQTEKQPRMVDTILRERANIENWNADTLRKSKSIDITTLIWLLGHHICTEWMKITSGTGGNSASVKRTRNNNISGK